MFCFAVALSAAIGTFQPGQIWATEKSEQGRGEIAVQLRLVTDNDVGPWFGAKTGGRDDTLYLLGMVTNTGPESAFVTLEVFSPNNPTIQAHDIAVGWVPPNGSVPVYFLRYLMQPPLKTKPSEVLLSYRIVSVKRK